jgi:hypothetical protein
MSQDRDDAHALVGASPYSALSTPLMTMIAEILLGKLLEIEKAVGRAD